MNKYKAIKTVIDGIVFPSKKQAKRYQELKLLEKVGVIKNLEMEINYPIIINGVKVCTYRADWKYMEDGNIIVEDTKGFRTPVYRLKKKLMLACHGIEIRET